MEPEENRTGRRWNLPLILLLILAATALFSAGTGRRTGSGIANTESKNAGYVMNRLRDAGYESRLEKGAVM